jgi:hypothetical protein
MKSEIFRSADRCGGFSLELIILVHSPDPIPNCQTAKVEIIIAQFIAICTGNVGFFLPAACGVLRQYLNQKACFCLALWQLQLGYVCKEQ